MIKVYLLPVERINRVDHIKGEQFIHNAIVDTTDRSDVRKLIMDTSLDEDAGLSAVALQVRRATNEEIAQRDALPLLPSLPQLDLPKEVEELKAFVKEIDLRLKKDVGGHTR